MDVILSRGGREFITETTFRGLTAGRVVSDPFDPSGRFPHLELSSGADLLAVAPASANSIAALARGAAEDLVGLTALSTTSRLLVAPAMEASMWQHPATQRNVAQLQRDGAHLAGPAAGYHASGGTGPGRMLEPVQLVGHIRLLLGQDGDLSGRRVVVTAGGTSEPVDDVRVLSNRSSGKMGTAIARAARDRGAKVTLVAASARPADDAGIEWRYAGTAEEMRSAVTEAATGADILLMAAAVADFRPAAVVEGKIHRSDGSARIDLIPTADIVQSIATRQTRTPTRPTVVVAFAAETADLEQRAREKLEKKHVDLVAANLVVGTALGGFGSEDNQLTIVGRDRDPERLPLMRKEQAAHYLLDRANELLEGASATAT